MSFSIEGKTAIVTGAANGVGLEIGRHFAEQGAKVMFADRDEDRLKAELGEDFADDSNIRYFTGDLRQHLTLANLLSATLDAFDRVDILVNSARFMQKTEDPLDPRDETVTELLEQNLIVSLRLSQMVAKRMVQQAEEDGREEGTVGSIINLSSIAARRANPQLLGYSISTAALDQMTRSLAVAFADHRIRVNSLSFGSVLSDKLKKAMKDDGGCRKEILNYTPIKRIAQARELAEAAQFLASDAAGFMTGQVVTLDGGRTLLDPVKTPAH